MELAEATGVPRWVIQMAEQAIKLPKLEHVEAIESILGPCFKRNLNKGGRNE